MKSTTEVTMALTVTQIVNAKLTAVFILLFLVFMCSWLPGKLITLLHRGLDNSLDQQRLQQVLTGMNCFAGGVFLATCLLDLFPEFRAMVTGTNERPESTEDTDTVFATSETDTPTSMDTPTSVDSRTFGFRRRRLILPKLSPSRDTEIVTSKDDERDYVYDTPLNRLRRHSSLKQDVINNNTKYSNGYLMHKSEIPVVEKQQTRSLDVSVIILLLVLAVHCIFDGLTVGLDPQPPPQALEVTVAVAIHKCVFAFSLGVQYAQSSQLTTGLNRSILCYSAASPIGIFTAFMFELIATNLANLQAMLGSVVPAIMTGTLAFKIFLDISPATCQP